MRVSSDGEQMPATVRWIAIVFVSAMAFYPAIAFDARALTADGDLWPQVLLIGSMMAAQVIATVLVWRGRRNWARWLVIALLVLDVPMYMVAMPEAVIHETSFLGLSAVQFALHFVVVFLLFTPSAAAWLRSSAPR